MTNEHRHVKICVHYSCPPARRNFSHKLHGKSCNNMLDSAACTKYKLVKYELRKNTSLCCTNASLENSWSPAMCQRWKSFRSGHCRQRWAQLSKQLYSISGSGSSRGVARPESSLRHRKRVTAPVARRGNKMREKRSSTPTALTQRPRPLETQVTPATPALGPSRPSSPRT